jgi:hypothetical protein
VAVKTWIFQGNPDLFDVDAYLATWPAECSWLVTKYGDEIEVGDRVFLWRNRGKQKSVAGVVAEATVAARAEPRPESPDARPFWRGEGNQANQTLPRALLRLNRIATKKEILRREWLEDDPVLRDLRNLKMVAGTNYLVSAEQTSRLLALWNRTGRDWSRDESVAGLWAYMKTYGGSISQLPGSPVTTVSLLIGRPVTGVYNKVMNFRALDPREARSGLSGGSEADRRVWREIFDAITGQLRDAELEAEFNRLWRSASGPTTTSVDAARAREVVEATARRFEEQTLDALLTRYRALTKTRPARPTVSTSTSRTIERDPIVVAIARKRANYRCEVPGCSNVTFTTSNGLPYCEVHHILPLTDGGLDTIENVACVCPSHHREAHHG